MTGIFRHRTLRSVAFWTLAASALALQVVVTVITTRLSTTVLSVTKIHSLSLSASALDICVVAALLVRLALCFYRHANNLLFVFSSGVITLSLVGAVLTVYSLAWTLQNESHTKDLAVAGMVFWTLALISQTALYVTLLRPTQRVGEAAGSEPMAERQSSPRNVKRSVSIHLNSLTPTKSPFKRPESATPSPKDSGFTLTPRSSIRDSVGQALRPIGSKTRLLVRTSFTSADTRSMHTTRPASFDTTHRHDGFENWDTSAVEEEPTSPCAQKNTRSRLETIPGSRPVSPARPLDGPFFGSPSLPRDAEETPLPDSPTYSPLTSPCSETSSIVAFPLPPPLRPSMSQSHIHPLFRPESPIPPPIPSPGTVILASPYAGQIVSADHGLSSRSHSISQGNRPHGLSPLSPTESRPGSSRSFRANSAASIEPPLPSSLRDG